MSETIKPELELKLNSEHYDMGVTEDGEEDKIILQQFKGEMDTIYLVLNGSQVTIPIDILKTAVDSMYNLASIELTKKEKQTQKEHDLATILLEGKGAISASSFKEILNKIQKGKIFSEG